MSGERPPPGLEGGSAVVFAPVGAVAAHDAGHHFSVGKNGRCTEGQGGGKSKEGCTGEDTS